MTTQTKAKYMKRVSFEEVKIEEYPYIHALRNKSLPNLESQDEPENLVGIAFSGGGIRSATFGLGVLEALKEKNLLTKIDYLSTVSGGGYIGSWLSANCKRTSDRIANQRRHSESLIEPSWLLPGSDWKKSISHLRRYSNYLSPNLSLLSADTWSMVTVWLRNTILVQLMVVFAMAFLLLLPRLFFLTFQDKEFISVVNILTILVLVATVFFIAPNLKTLNPLNSSFCSQVPNYKFDQKTIVNLAILLLIGSFGFSTLLWSQASENAANTALDSFMGCITFLLNKDWIMMVFTYFSFALFSYCSTRQSNRKIIIDWFVAPITATVVMTLLLAAILLILDGWTNPDYDIAKGKCMAFVWAPTFVIGSLSFAINIFIGMLGRDTDEYIREWWSRFGAWLAIIGFAWMVIVIAAVYGPLWFAWLYFEGSWKTLGSGWLITTMAGLFAGKASDTGNPEQQGSKIKLKEIAAKLAPFLFIAGLLITVSSLLHGVLAFNSKDHFEISRNSLLVDDAVQSSRNLALGFDKSLKAISNDQFNNVNISMREFESAPFVYTKHWKLLTDASQSAIIVSLVVCGLCVWLLGKRVDINEFSLNAFYRNRLARCYLGATRKPEERDPHPFTGFDAKDDLNLAELLNDTLSPSGPLHIVNCALNLGGSSDLALHTRHSNIFALTALRCGSSYEIKNQNSTVSEQLGYVETFAYMGQEQPTLGQAISVSGAAASPNMGYHTSESVAFLMTLFNARLGWWFPSPSDAKSCQQPSPTFSLWYLLRELFGFANEKSSFLAISDGGHFENLGAFELIKRRCKVIIISDGECDPKLQFEGLATLIRMCEVDNLVKKIDIDVHDIHPESESGWSRSRCAIGKIYYGTYDPSREPDGWLIYIKASMNGREDTAVMQYKATHPNFPHETTGDQFYAENQFESYRSLGKNITDQLFSKVINKAGQTINSIGIDKEYMVNMAKELHKVYSPTFPNQAQFTRHSDGLMKIWELLSKSENLIPLDKELFQSWDGNKPERSTFYLCSALIQQMENVYLDLDLEDTWGHVDNKGWRELFEQWAKSPSIAATWDKTSNTYSERFRSFWSRNLEFPING